MFSRVFQVKTVLQDILFLTMQVMQNVFEDLLSVSKNRSVTGNFDGLEKITNQYCVYDIEVLVL